MFPKGSGEARTLNDGEFRKSSDVSSEGGFAAQAARQCDGSFGSPQPARHLVLQGLESQFSACFTLLPRLQGL